MPDSPSLPQSSYDRCIASAVEAYSVELGILHDFFLDDPTDIDDSDRPRIREALHEILDALDDAKIGATLRTVHEVRAAEPLTIFDREANRALMLAPAKDFTRHWAFASEGAEPFEWPPFLARAISEGAAVERVSDFAEDGEVIGGQCSPERPYTAVYSVLLPIGGGVDETYYLVAEADE